MLLSNVRVMLEMSQIESRRERGICISRFIKGPELATKAMSPDLYLKKKRNQSKRETINAKTHSFDVF